MPRCTGCTSFHCSLPDCTGRPSAQSVTSHRSERNVHYPNPSSPSILVFLDAAFSFHHCRHHHRYPRVERVVQPTWKVRGGSSILPLSFHVSSSSLYGRWHLARILLVLLFCMFYHPPDFYQSINLFFLLETDPLLPSGDVSIPGAIFRESLGI